MEPDLLCNGRNLEMPCKVAAVMLIGATNIHHTKPNMDEQDVHFKSTRWTTVLRAGQGDSPGADLALARLCTDYRPPLLAFARAWLKSLEDAEDLTQEFFRHLIQHNLPGTADRERGRFRTFLLACFKNYMRDEWRRRRRAREIPAALLSSLDAEDSQDSARTEPAVAPSFEHQLDLLWAESIQQRVMRSLEEEYFDRGHGALFQRLRCLLSGQDLPQPYAELAADLGTSEESIKQAVLRLRLRFRKQFRAEVAQTVAASAEVDEEYRYLISLLFSEGSAT